jgi:hypothetical protein
MRLLGCILAAIPVVAAAGGSNYGIVPGAQPNLAGKVTEWPMQGGPYGLALDKAGNV